MALQRITFRPGINKQATPTLNEGGWSDGNLVRFRDGMPQPIGGWKKQIVAPFAGACRKMHAWVTLGSEKLLALGTSSQLAVARGDALFDITPAGLAPGHPDVPYGRGFGAGPFGRGTFGTSRAALVQSGGLRLWSLDNWGEELVACVRDGGIYRWRPTDGFTTRAAALAGAPALAKGVMVGMPERHLIAFGAGDPLTVAWSDVENYNVWTASATNSAGSFPLVGGSEIRAWQAAQGEILIWTDTSLWAMRFQSLPTVYGFYRQGSDGCGVISPNAATELDGSAYWMGTQGFFRYSGQALPVPCDVWDAVFLDLNTAQAAKIHCGRNTGWNEVTWFYPSKRSNEIDRYVTLDVVNGRWSLGELRRTAWIDADVYPNPLAASIDYPGEATVPIGLVYAHEFGNDADGQPMNDFVESGFFDIGDGAEISFVDEVIPDFADLSGTVLLTLKSQMFPNGATRTKGPFPVINTTRHISPRIRGRQLALRIESSGSGSSWRLGAMRARIAPDGRK
jgi:hypothetical protein